MAILTVSDDAVGDVALALKMATRTVRGAKNAVVKTNSEGVIIEAPPPHLTSPGRLQYNGCVVSIQNKSGSDLSRFNVLGIDSAYYNPSTHENLYYLRKTLKGVTPTSIHTSKFAILLQDIANDAVGKALCRGVTAVKINMINTDHTYAGIKDGDGTVLESKGNGPCKILSVESGTGVKWALVVISDSKPITEYARITTAPSTGDRKYICKLCKSDGTWLTEGDPPPPPATTIDVECGQHMFGPHMDCYAHLNPTWATRFSDFGVTHCIPNFKINDVIPIKQDVEGRYIPDFFLMNTFLFMYEDPTTSIYVGTVWCDNTNDGAEANRRLREVVGNEPAP